MEKARFNISPGLLHLITTIVPEFKKLSSAFITVQNIELVIRQIILGRPRNDVFAFLFLFRWMERF